MAVPWPRMAQCDCQKIVESRRSIDMSPKVAWRSRKKVKLRRFRKEEEEAQLEAAELMMTEGMFRSDIEIEAHKKLI